MRSFQLAVGAVFFVSYMLQQFGGLTGVSVIVTLHSDEDQTEDEVGTGTSTPPIHADTSDQILARQIQSQEFLQQQSESTVEEAARFAKQNMTISKVTVLSPGTTLFENVCMNRPKNRVGIIAFRDPNSTEVWGKKRKFLEVPFAKFVDINTGLSPGLTAVVEHPSVWNDWNSESDTRLVEEPVVWLHGQELQRNPAHCLSDMLLPFALDRYYRGRTDLAFPQPSINVNETDPSLSFPYPNPFYGKWLLGHGYAFSRPHGADGWCRDVAELAGFIKKENHLTFPETADHKTCFRKLIVGHPAMWRYPRSIREDPIQVKLVRKQLVVRQDLIYKHKDQALDYPTGALQDFRRSIQDAYQLPYQAWPDLHASSSDNKKPKQILFHTRSDHQRRRIVNLEDLQQRLEEHYLVNITVMKDAWANYTVEEQFQTYNSFQYILTGHGAHQANGIACRPKTHIMEIFCKVRSAKLPNPKLTLKPRHFMNTTDYVDWYGASPYMWFSLWGRRLGMEHYELGQEKCIDIGIEERYNRNHNIELDLEMTVEMMVNRFQLIPRSRPATGTIKFRSNKNSTL